MLKTFLTFRALACRKKISTSNTMYDFMFDSFIFKEMYERRDSRCTDLKTRIEECMVTINRVTNERNEAIQKQNELVVIRDDHMNKVRQ